MRIPLPCSLDAVLMHPHGSCKIARQVAARGKDYAGYPPLPRLRGYSMRASRELARSPQPYGIAKEDSNGWTVRCKYLDHEETPSSSAC